LIWCPYCGPFLYAKHQEWFVLKQNERLI
jgi:hypothetical protein